MSSEYPIEPGSAIDLALTSCARHIALNDPLNLEAIKLVTVSDSAQMLALGTRILLMRFGVSEPDNLVSPIHAQWYGQPSGVRDGT